MLQDKMGKMKKTKKKIPETKVTKTPKTKRRKYGMNETLGCGIYYQNNNHIIEIYPQREYKLIA